MRADGGLDQYHATRQQARSVVSLAGRRVLTTATGDAPTGGGGSVVVDASVGFLLNRDHLNTSKMRS